MGTEKSALSVYYPLVRVCGLTLVPMLFNTILIIVRRRAVRHSPSLLQLLLYISVNASLACCLIGELIAIIGTDTLIIETLESTSST